MNVLDAAVVVGSRVVLSSRPIADRRARVDLESRSMFAATRAR
jgi:hypothetical protein